MPHDDLQQVAQSFATRIPPLEAQLTRLVQSVPAGSVVTYGDLAEALGDTVASRWVATILLEPDGPLAESSHRVVRVNGEIGLYHTGDPRQKRARLQSEGVDVHGGKVDLRRYRFTLAAPRPLAKLKQWQMSFTPPTVAPLPLEKVQTIGGIDVSYAGRMGVAVCSRYQSDGRTRLEPVFIQRPAPFPYVSGYLSFREIPLYLELLGLMQQQGDLPDVLLVDGNGRLHPRRCGIATMLGAITQVPTIGVAKSKLCGTLLAATLQVGRPEAVVASRDTPDEILGYAVLPSTKTKHPLYISQGFGVDDQLMLTLVARTLATRRLPEPIYDADRLSRQLASRLPS